MGHAQEQLAELMREAFTVVALTGAGISVPSGIPDFRTPGTGLWSEVDPMEVAHVDVWREHPERFWAFYAHRFHTLADRQPNRAHAILAQWERAGRLDAVITQNVDGLHQRAGSRNVVEVHGSITSSRCFVCGASFDLDEVTARIAADPAGIPRCDNGHPLKPNVVLFGEDLPAAAMAHARQLVRTAELLICIGTSLEVYPVSELPAMTLTEGGQLAIVTRSHTDYDRSAAVRLDGDVVDELEAVAGLL